MKNVCFIAALAALSAANTVNAQNNSGVYVNPKAAVAEYASETFLQNEALYGLGVGYRFTNSFAVEGSYLTGDSSTKHRRPVSADVDVWDIRALYHFLESNKLSPYASVGFGQQDVGLVRHGSESQVSGGIGLRWRFLGNLHGRAEYNFYDGQEAGGLKRIFNVGLQYRFGSQPKKMATKPRIVDADKDGVRDSQDKCLGTPVGRMVDSTGCASPKDEDQDGIADAADQCPGTTNKNRNINNVGCYEVEVIAAPSEMVTAIQSKKETFYFAHNSVVTDARHDAQAREIAGFLRGGSNHSAHLTGHTDSTGADSYNFTLSGERVEAVKALLLTHTPLTSNEITTKSYGESRPTQSNGTSASRQKNRRVEVIVRTEKQKPRQ